MTEQLLTIEQVGAYIGRSRATIQYWYKWKEDNPEHELAKLLPEYIQNGTRQTRYWKASDLWRLIEFRQRIPQGRGGIMKESIYRYFHGGPENERNNVQS